MVKLIDVARTAGVGVGTASRALSGNGSVDAVTKERVRAVAKELGYSPDTAARALRERRTRTIGLLVPDLANEFYTASVAVLHQVLSDAGYQLVIAATGNDPAAEQKALQNMIDQRVEGLVHVPVDAGLNFPATVPLVQLNRRSNAKDTAAATSDDVAGVDQLTTAVIQAGHRDIAVIVGPADFSTSRDRLSGVLRAAERAGVPESEHLVDGARLRILRAPLTPDGGAAAVSELVADLPSCLIALSSRLVMGALRECGERGISIPETMSLAGFGDPDWFSIWRPGITTFAPNLTEMGRQAATMLLHQLEGHSAERLALVPGKVQIRGSVTGLAVE